MSVSVAFDAGTSGSKVIATYTSGEYPFDRVENYFLVDPSVRPLTQQTYQDMLDGIVDGGGGLGSSLVSYIDPNSGQRVYWELGETAARPGLLSVRDRKFEKLLAKVLGFVGYLVQVEMQATELVKLNLGVLLPFDEIEDRRILAQWLRQILGTSEDGVGFVFNGMAITNVCLEAIDCKPEGYGIYKSYAGDRVSVLVIGHSDSSWLYFNQGALNKKLSCTLPETGMHDFIGGLSFPITDELRAAQLLSQTGASFKPNLLAELTQTRSEAELAYLQQAIQSAKAQYWTDPDGVT